MVNSTSQVNINTNTKDTRQFSQGTSLANRLGVSLAPSTSSHSSKPLNTYAKIFTEVSSNNIDLDNDVSKGQQSSLSLPSNVENKAKNISTGSNPTSSSPILKNPVPDIIDLDGDRAPAAATPSSKLLTPVVEQNSSQSNYNQNKELANNEFLNEDSSEQRQFTVDYADLVKAPLTEKKRKGKSTNSSTPNYKRFRKVSALSIFFSFKFSKGNTIFVVFLILSLNTIFFLL